jgi:hypothetical protein
MMERFSFQGVSDAGAAGFLETHAQAFDPEFPAYFPRFIQFSIWALCAHQRLNICNGNRIDGDARCNQREGPVFSGCARILLRTNEIKSRASKKARRRGRRHRVLADGGGILSQRTDPDQGIG